MAREVGIVFVIGLICAFAIIGIDHAIRMEIYTKTTSWPEMAD